MNIRSVKNNEVLYCECSRFAYVVADDVGYCRTHVWRIVEHGEPEDIVELGRALTIINEPEPAPDTEPTVRLQALITDIANSGYNGWQLIFNKWVGDSRIVLIRCSHRWTPSCLHESSSKT